MHFTIRENYETIVPENHNQKYKLSKGGNRLIKFGHIEGQYFFCWLVQLFLKGGKI